MALEDKYDDIKKLVDAGKEKGYLTYDQVNELIPQDVVSPDDLDDLLTTMSTQGIDVLEGPKLPSAALDKKFDESEEGEDVELDLTPWRSRKNQRSRPHQSGQTYSCVSTFESGVWLHIRVLDSVGLSAGKDCGAAQFDESTASRALGQCEEMFTGQRATGVSVLSKSLIVPLLARYNRRGEKIYDDIQ